MNERQRPASWEDLERMTGIKRNVPPSPTQRDAANLTAKRLRRWPAWARKLR